MEDRTMRRMMFALVVVASLSACGSDRRTTVVASPGSTVIAPDGSKIVTPDH
jgi:hypothetical protein